MLTPQYASPEQRRGEGPSVPGDIYSLGRLLEEILPAAAVRSDLRYILKRTMEEAPGDRYLSVPDLLEDLRRLREGFPLRARPATAAYVADVFCVETGWCCHSPGCWRCHWPADGGGQSELPATRPPPQPRHGVNTRPPSRTNNGHGRTRRARHRARNRQS